MKFESYINVIKSISKSYPNAEITNLNKVKVTLSCDGEKKSILVSSLLNGESADVSTVRKVINENTRN